MATARHRLVDPQQPLFYHLISRCVRRSRLCGRDRVTRRDYSHRKHWLIERIEHLGKVFPIEVHAYAIMSNHFHLVVYYDPTACASWSDQEVVRRWLNACPPRQPDGSVDLDKQALLAEQWLEQPERVQAIRTRLASLSTFMQRLKQPIARRANLEDGCKGHFFEQRFYSGALLDEEAVVAAMAYVDLNPIRARIARSIAACKHTSLTHRLSQGDSQARLDEYMAPIVSGLDRENGAPMTLAGYREHLEMLIEVMQSPNSKSTRWHQWMSALQRQQRVYGSIEKMTAWLAARNMQPREVGAAVV